MKPWYCLSLGDGMIAPMPSAEIEEAFLQVFTAAGNPPEMAVFTRPESEGRLHCEVIAYFSQRHSMLSHARNLREWDWVCWPEVKWLGLLYSMKADSLFIRGRVESTQNS